ncbi:MAG: NMD3-related protein [Desulfurococcaceae archaeon]
MWFCIRCGKEMPRSELIRGYCPDCFIKYVNVFKKTPDYKLVKCPVCSSWYHKGEWYPLTLDIDAVEHVIRSELVKYLIDGVKLEDMEIDSYNYIDQSNIKVRIKLALVVDEKPVSLSQEYSVRVEYNKCPKCVSRTIGKYTHLVQVRFTSRNYPRAIINDILSLLSLNIHRESIVDIKELEEGVDIELDDATTTRKIIESLSKNYSAKITSSFKPTRFDPSQGKWIGVTTYVARIPVFNEDEVVIYRNKLGIVRAIDRDKLIIEIPELGELKEIDIKSYWKNELKQPLRVEQEVLYVRDIHDTQLIIENPATKETITLRAIDRLKNLKIGDQIILIKADNIETIVPRKKGG